MPNPAIRKAVERIKRSARTGVRLTIHPPASASALKKHEKGIRPHFGTISWKLSPGYLEFLAIANGLSWQETDADGFDSGFTLFDEKEKPGINADLVHLPEGVRRNQRELSTNHLVGFATLGGESVWCFDVTTAGAKGEYPVYYHHQDEPRARVRKSGRWENEADAEPDFSSFAAWFSAMAAVAVADKKPRWWVEGGNPAIVHAARQGLFRKQKG